MSSKLSFLTPDEHTSCFQNFITKKECPKQKLCLGCKHLFTTGTEYNSGWVQPLLILQLITVVGKTEKILSADGLN